MNEDSRASEQLQQGRSIQVRRQSLNIWNSQTFPVAPDVCSSRPARRLFHSLAPNFAIGLAAYSAHTMDCRRYLIAYLACSDGATLEDGSLLLIAFAGAARGATRLAWGRPLSRVATSTRTNKQLTNKLQCPSSFPSLLRAFLASLASPTHGGCL